MPFAVAAGIGAVATIASSAIGAGAAQSAADTQAAAANNATQAQLDMFHQTQTNEQPFLQAGQNALPLLLAGTGAGPGGTGTGPLNRQFTMQDFQQSPGYNFQMQQGTNAVLNNASSLGGVNSGNTLKALTSFGQGVANQDYWNQYNAFVNRQNQQFGQLQTIAGSGQNAAANLGALGTQVGQSVGNNIIGAGNAQAAGQVGTANALSGGINNLASNYQLYSLLNGSGNPFGDSATSPANLYSGYGVGNAGYTNTVQLPEGF